MTIGGKDEVNELGESNMTNTSGVLKELELTTIFPTKENTRKIVKGDPGIKELAESITSHGLLQPVICRPVKNKFELLAGARRFAACQLLEMKTLPALVRELDDKAALEVTVLENLQREDLSPLEQGLGIAKLMKSGQEVAAIAANIGKSEMWVRRRAKLASLSKKWLTKLEKDPQFRLLSAAHLELVAHLKENMQDRLLDKNFNAQMHEPVSLWKQRLAHMTNVIARAPWQHAGLLDSEQLEAMKKKLRDCVTCQERSDADDLFKGVHEDYGPQKDVPRCLNADCWAKNIAVWKECVAAGFPGAQKPTFRTNDYHMKGFDYLETYNTKVEKKEFAGSKPVVIVNEGKKPEVVWVKEKKQRDYNTSYKEPKPKVATIEQKRLYHQRNALLKWRAKVKKCPATMTDVQLLGFALAFGLYAPIDENDRLSKEKLETLLKSPASLRETVWQRMRGTEPFEYCWSPTAVKENVQGREIELFCEAMGLERQDFLDAAEKAFPEKKGQGGQGGVKPNLTPALSREREREQTKGKKGGEKSGQGKAKRNNGDTAGNDGRATDDAAA